MSEYLENNTLGVTSLPVNPALFNRNCVLPYSLAIEHIHKAMSDFLGFLDFINQQLHTKHLPRLECFLMPASFSSLVGEFMNITIPKYCATLEAISKFTEPMLNSRHGKQT